MGTSPRRGSRKLEATRRAVRVRIGGEERWIAIEDTARYRDGLGVSPPSGVPDAFLGATADPLGGLLARWARTHGPFVAAEPAARWGIAERAVDDALARLLESGTILRGEFRPGGSEREWCDPDVLRQLRRRSLARLRREVEPVEPAAYARFLAAWQGVSVAGSHEPPARGAIALERLAEVVGQLAGLALPASVLERDILPARVPGYLPRLLDELGALGEVGWIGRGSLGRDDGRIALVRPGRETPLGAGSTAGSPGRSRAGGADRGAGGGDGRADRGTDAGATDRPTGPLVDALREALARRGALFYRQLHQAAGGGPDREVLDAMWDLVWAGELTNDTFAPLRALRWHRPARDPARRAPRVAALGPPEAAGRWSLVDAEAIGDARVTTARLHATALGLLERYGVLTREAVVAEGIPGGFAAVYPVLRALEEAGRARRGYFVEGMGAAQFALPGAVDRLRAVRDSRPDEPVVHLLAAADPAVPYGAAVPWPRRGDDDERRVVQRAAGAHVVLVEGEPVVYLERGGKGLVTLPAFDDAATVLIANITPFRGPSADVGTVYEMGFAHALGKKVFAYTNVAMPFTERTIKALGNQVNRSQDGKLRDAQGMFVEENGLIDNLMIDGCINANSKFLVVEEAPADQLFTYLGGFEKCLGAAQQLTDDNQTK